METGRELPGEEAGDIHEEVNDVRRVRREFRTSNNAEVGHFEAFYNSALSRSLLSGVVEFDTSNGGASRYEGMFMNDPENECPMPHGEGVRRNTDGSTYSGQWKSGTMHGHGELVGPPPANETYVGDWRNGKRHGFGTQTFGNGDRYEGDWVEGKFHDRGTFKSANGDRFEGIWADGMKKYGSIYFVDGRVSRRTFDSGRLMSCQDFDPRRRAYLPTKTRRETHKAGMSTEYPDALEVRLF